MFLLLINNPISKIKIDIFSFSIKFKMEISFVIFIVLIIVDLNRSRTVILGTIFFIVIFYSFDYSYFL